MNQNECGPVRVLCSLFIGLSKGRPILGDHPKAHIHEIRRISKDQLPGMVSPIFYRGLFYRDLSRKSELVNN